MYHRRLKIFLLIVLAGTLVLLARALQIQVLQRGQWDEQAARTFAPPAQLVETLRGRILDFRGREVAVDEPCMDLCVDYRAILDTPDDKWVRSLAARRLASRLGTDYTDARRSKKLALIDAEVPRVLADIQAMWTTIAQVSGKSFDELEELRQTIVQRVEMRRRYLWVHRWRQAVTKQTLAIPEAPWYRRWLMGESNDHLQLDSFDLEVDEQRQPHVVLPDVSNDIINFFGHNPAKYPGLVLRPGVKRFYPFDEAGCHLIGHLGKVSREDLLTDNDEDELRKYWPNDEIGRTGVEALAEPLLRGSRGRILKIAGKETEHVDPKPGQDVRLTIDIQLQREIQRLFKDVPIKDPDKTFSHHVMHGAAVVIDVPTGEVRALASYPDFDLNTLDSDYSKLAADDLNLPLLNRATQVAREPGSTAKPMVGLSAVTAGVIPPDFRVECRGYLYIDGKRYGVGRCWVASKFEKILGPNGVAHHPVPSIDPHPTGFLSLADALERSCNVYFETVGDKLKLDGETTWFRRFGLGRPTGIGIPESSGYVPGDFQHIPVEIRRSTSWFAGIGQGRVAATPIQMANVVATIARGGIWEKPRLLVTGTPLPAPRPSTQPADKQAYAEDRVDLHLNPQALAEVHQGMVNVVYSLAGTGRTVAHRDENDRELEPELAHLHIAGKTGTAQASRLRVAERDSSGNPLKDADGKPVYKLLEPTPHGQNGGKLDWYRAADAEGKHVNHAWFIGFAPAENPRLAFAVMVEYGESGGETAGRLAKRVLEACIRNGYLPSSPGTPGVSKEVANRD